MKIVIIGHICIDHNVSEKTSYIGPGGPGKFINKALSKINNCQISIIAPYGRDFLSYTKGQKILPAKPTINSTLTYENITQNGKRIQKALNRKEARPVKIQKEESKIIEQADVIFITPLLPNFTANYIKKINRLAKKNVIKVLLPQGYFRSFDAKNKVTFRKFLEASKVLPLIDFAIVSNRDYPNIENLSSVWARKYKTTIIITLEDKGALIVEKDKKTLVPTKAVDKNRIIDSVGCGDVFSAGFAYGYFNTKSLIKAVDFANKLARKHLLS
jgi:sugar/nucleoside kinase (ribokinase family)